MTRLVLLLLAVAGCARMIDQHANTGPDGESDGAEPIELANGVGESEGEVTYPGGDRVDWKVIELPPGHFGRLELELEWRSPRDGADLGLVVWSAAGKELEHTPDGRRRNKRTGDKELTVENARGTIYVLVYATARSDAGSYELAVKFVDQTPPPPVTLDSLIATGKFPVGDPPKIGSVPEACKEDDFDPDNPDCIHFPPPCDRDNPNKKNPSCKKLCNKDKLDPKNPDCKQFYPACQPDYKTYDKTNPNCAGIDPVYPPPPPIAGAVMNVEIQNGKTVITLSVAKDLPIQTGWAGTLVDAKGKPVEKGEFKVVSYKGKTVKGYVALSYDEANRSTQGIIYYPLDWVTPEE